MIVRPILNCSNMLLKDIEFYAQRNGVSRVVYGYLNNRPIAILMKRYGKVTTDITVETRVDVPLHKQAMDLSMGRIPNPKRTEVRTYHANLMEKDSPDFRFSPTQRFYLYEQVQV